MFYKYKKYKKKYMNIKNQVGGECVASPSDDDDDEPLIFEKYSQFRFPDALINPSNTCKTCFSSIGLARLIHSRTGKVKSRAEMDIEMEQNRMHLFGDVFINMYMPDLFPFKGIFHPLNRSCIDINLIWYIIIINNKYIIELNDFHIEDTVDKYTEQEISDKEEKTFLYSNNDKIIIEYWLAILKECKIFICTVDNIPSYEKFIHMNTLDSDNYTKFTNYINECSSFYALHGITINIPSENIVYTNARNTPDKISYGIFSDNINYVMVMIQTIVLSYDNRPTNTLHKIFNTNIKHDFDQKVLVDSNEFRSIHKQSINAKLEFINTTYTEFINKIEGRLKSPAVTTLIAELDDYIYDITYINTKYRTFTRVKYLTNMAHSVNTKIITITERMTREDNNSDILYEAFLKKFYIKNLKNKCFKLKYIIKHLLKFYNYIFIQNDINKDSNLKTNNMYSFNKLLKETLTTLLFNVKEFLSSPEKEIEKILNSKEFSIYNTISRNRINNNYNNIENKCNSIIKYLDTYKDLVIIDNINNSSYEQLSYFNNNIIDLVDRYTKIISISSPTNPDEPIDPHIQSIIKDKTYTNLFTDIKMIYNIQLQTYKNLFDTYILTMTNNIILISVDDSATTIPLVLDDIEINFIDDPTENYKKILRMYRYFKRLNIYLLYLNKLFNFINNYMSMQYTINRITKKDIEMKHVDADADVNVNVNVNGILTKINAMVAIIKLNDISLEKLDYNGIDRYLDRIEKKIYKPAILV